MDLIHAFLSALVAAAVLIAIVRLSARPKRRTQYLPDWDPKSNVIPSSDIAVELRKGGRAGQKPSPADILVAHHQAALKKRMTSPNIDIEEDTNGTKT